MKIAVIGLDHVGLSNAVLSAQHDEAIAADITAGSVAMLAACKSPIVDGEFETFLAGKPSNLTAMFEPQEAPAGADYADFAIPTNYDVDTRGLFGSD